MPQYIQYNASMKISLTSPLLRAMIALGLGLIWILLSASALTATSPGAISAPQAGFTAPDIVLSDQNGTQFQLSNLRGKAVVLNFWASWCPPCRAEMPDLQAIHQEYAAQELLILGVNATSQDSVSDALEFANAMGLTFPILLDESGSASRAYQVNALPTTFFINADGVIEEVVYGGPMSGTLLRLRIDALLEP